jgi:hypothetical protein
VLLDAVTIMRSVLSDQQSTIQQLSALDQLWHGSLMLLSSLETTFLSANPSRVKEPDASERALWERRTDRAAALLKDAGLEIAEQSLARAKYVALRTQWDSHIEKLAPSMLYSMQEIDRAMYDAGHGAQS